MDFSVLGFKWLPYPFDMWKKIENGISIHIHRGEKNKQFRITCALFLSTNYAEFRGEIYSFKGTKQVIEKLKNILVERGAIPWDV